MQFIVDYCAPCLPHFTPTRLQSLEVLENNALCVILGALQWKRLCNVEGECGLPSLYLYILARTSTAVAKITYKHPDSALVRQIFHAIQLPVNLVHDGDWGSRCCRCSQGTRPQGVVCRSPGRPHPNTFHHHHGPLLHCVTLSVNCSPRDPPTGRATSSGLPRGASHL